MYSRRYCAGVIGALTGFTQPVITAVITGPAAVRLGVEPNKVAGIQAHAGHIGNLAGFTHPTQVAILATAGIGYGLFNVLGLIASLSIFAMSAFRVILDMHKRGVTVSEEDRLAVMAEINAKQYQTTSVKAFFPFVVLLVGFIMGLPIFLVGLVSALCVMVLAHKNMKSSEQAMMQGVGLIGNSVGCYHWLPLHEYRYQTDWLS